MNYLLLSISILIETFKNSCTNHFSKNLVKTHRDNMFFNAVLSFGAVIFFLCAGPQFNISTFSFIMALIFAIVTAGAQLTLILALACGPMSFSVLFTYLGGILIPTAYSAIAAWKLPNIYQFIGLGFMLVTVFTSTNLKKENKISAKWLLFATISLIMWGLVGVCQGIHQNSKYKNETTGFLFCSFVIMTILFLLIALMLKREDNPTYKLISKGSIWITLAGIATGSINLINLYLIGHMDGVIFFPVANGGVILLSGIAAILIFKEKLSKIQMMSMISGIIAVCLLCIEF